MARVQPGDLVRIHYTGRLANGMVFGTSQGQEPVEFAAGSDQILKGISQAVLGMEEDETKTITLTPEQAFGERDPLLERQVPRTALPADVKVGDRLMAQSGAHQHPVWVRQLGEEWGVVDGNHPLAGEALTFEIKLISTLPAEESS
jgi:peptidylprolyl isomerase